MAIIFSKLPFKLCARYFLLLEHLPLVKNFTFAPEEAFQPDYIDDLEQDVVDVSLKDVVEESMEDVVEEIGDGRDRRREDRRQEKRELDRVRDGGIRENASGRLLSKHIPF